MKPTTVATHGFRHQRHVDALWSAEKLFAADKVRKATVRSGLSMEYAVHSRDVPDATEDELVVLIVGFWHSHEVWAMVVHHLLATWSSSTKNLKILTFDNRGFGGTDATWGRYTTTLMAEDTVGLMDHLGWKQAHIVGMSMGGMIALEIASNFASRVRSLSLMVTTRGHFVNTKIDSTTVKMFLASDQEVVAASMLSTLYPHEFLAKKMADRDETIHEVLYAKQVDILQHRRPGSAFGLTGQLLAIGTHYVSDERLAAIGDAGFPVLIIGSGKDKLMPVSESKLLAEHIKGDHVKLVIYEDGGHGVYVQYLEEVVDELLGVIRCRVTKDKVGTEMHKTQAEAY